MLNFDEIKKQRKRYALILSAVLGVCCGVTVACALLIGFKLGGVDFFWALYIPIALTAGGAAFGLFYLALRPTDKRLAKQLDKRYSLNEKVQTMVEYMPSSDAMAQLQRAQADGALEGAARERLGVKQALKFIAVPVLALAMLFTGVFLPAKTRPVQGEPVYDITQTQETALLNLIADVQSSELETELKGSVKGVLTQLLDNLRDGQTASVMRASVISSVKLIDALVGGSNSFAKLCAALNSDEELSALSGAIIGGATFYKKTGVKLNSFAVVKSAAKESDARIADALSAWVEEHLLSYGTPDATGAIVPAAASVSAGKVMAYAQKLGEKLNGAGIQNNADMLLVSAKSFVSSQVSLAYAIGGMSDTNFYNGIEAVCVSFSENCAAALVAQSYACMMDDYIRTALSRIFGIPLSEFGSNEEVVPAVPEKPGNSGEASGGGYGDGEVQYGSNDLVLDVDTGRFVEYGVLLNKYSAMVSERIADGACSDEVAKYVRQYFQILSSGLNEDK